MLILDCIILAILVAVVSWEGEVNKVLTRMIDHKEAVKYEILQITNYHWSCSCSIKFALFMQRIMCKYRVIPDL